MATYRIKVSVRLDDQDEVDEGSWVFSPSSTLIARPKTSKYSVLIWELEAIQNGQPVKDKLYFATQSKQKKAGIEIKGVQGTWPGNSWLTGDEAIDLDGKVKGPKPKSQPNGSKPPVEYRWNINPHTIMKEISDENEADRVHCYYWVRIVDAAGNVSEIDPEVRLKSRF